MKKPSEFSVSPTLNQIISSYSNVPVAIHTMQWGSLPTSTAVSFPSESRKVEALTEVLLEETACFDAHTLFGEPLEVWTYCWCRCITVQQQFYKELTIATSRDGILEYRHKNLSSAKQSMRLA